MPETISAPCALCNEPAHFEYHDNGQRLYYDCPKCHHYVISKFAVSYLDKNAAYPKIKEDIITEIKALFSESQDYHIYEITTPPPGSATGHYLKCGGLTLVKVLRSKYSS